MSKAVKVEDLSVVKTYIDNKSTADLATVDTKISTAITEHNDDIYFVHNGITKKAEDAYILAGEASLGANAAYEQATVAYDQSVNAEGLANQALSVAEGRARAVVFDTKAAMTSALKGATSEEYKVGDNLFIKEVGVPDYWVSSILEANTGTYGYYEIAELETQKVDLTDYATTENLSVAIISHNSDLSAHADIRNAVNTKASKDIATPSADGLMSADDKKKFNALPLKDKIVTTNDPQVIDGIKTFTTLTTFDAGVMSDSIMNFDTKKLLSSSAETGLVVGDSMATVTIQALSRPSAKVGVETKGLAYVDEIPTFATTAEVEAIFS